MVIFRYVAQKTLLESEALNAVALATLSLRDFVIVAQLDLELDGGFTALTGETGAGKSILIDALQLLLGARGDALWVREGHQRCEIAATFDALPAAAQAWLRGEGFDDGSEEPLLLRRSIDAAGKSRAWIGGSPATIGQLRTLGTWLVDIHGQHAWQSLTRPATVRALLDGWGGIDAAPLAALWHEWQTAEKALAAAREAQESLQEERERLLWQIKELEALAPQEDEWEELSASHARLANAQALIDAAHSACEALEGGGHEGGALPGLNAALSALQKHTEIEPQFVALCEVLGGCIAQAQDALHSLRGWLRRSAPDPQQLAQLDERMGLWMQHARRWRRTPQDLPALLAGWRAELARLDDAVDVEALAAAAEQAHAAYLRAADRISQQRAAAAPKLAAAVTAAMQQLGMAGGRFAIALDALPAPAAHGLEGVTFQVAGHEGATPRALERVASGGELSRLALAIAVTTSRLGEAPTLLFDEIDSGVGGAVALAVGSLLRQLGADRQVLCVTHLAQVAASGHNHLRVSKKSAHGETTSTVAAITGRQRAEEIARMLAGSPTDASLAHAREMLAAAAAAQEAP